MKNRLQFPSATEYRDALEQASMTPRVRALLEALYRAPSHTSTALDLARAVGETTITTASSTFGGFGSILRGKLRVPNDGDERVSAIIASIEPPDASFESGRLVMVPALVTAIKSLKWFPEGLDVAQSGIDEAVGKSEPDWLRELATIVQARLTREHNASVLRPVNPKAFATDESSDGWYSGIGTIRGESSALYLFIDNSLGEGRRALWYGVWSKTRAEIDVVEEAGRSRWPHTQAWGHDDGVPAGFRYDEPWLQHFRRDEHYYGWLEADEPEVSRSPSPGLARRIAERLSGLLFEMTGKGPDSETDLDRLDQLDGFRTATVRLEQGLLRTMLLGKRKSADCAICGEEFDASLLVAAHIKRRADATDTERRAASESVMALCTFGCDALFERGYLVVQRGTIVAGPREGVSSAVSQRVKQLAGRRCAGWTKENDHLLTRIGSGMSKGAQDPETRASHKVLGKALDAHCQCHLLPAQTATFATS